MTALPPFDRRSVLLAGGALTACAATGIAPRAPEFSLADLKERTFRFFWETTDPRTGLAHDRWPTKSFSSIAAVGFALTAYPIGVVNRWITREQAAERTLATLRFFDRAPQGPEARGRTGHKGFFYHFLDFSSGTRFETTELSTVDTALLLGGMLFAQSWFDRDDPRENEIRRLADAIYARVDWNWIRPRAPFVAMGWKPEGGFLRYDWDRFNEAMLLYILALGSPSHAIEPEAWTRWTATFDRNWGAHYGEPHIGFAPLFGHQYSQVWIDFRGIRDAYGRRRSLDYFENSRRATIAQRNYAIANPMGWAGYGRDIWGLTACDGPGDFKRTIGGVERQFYSYSARGPGAGERDDGTIAPTAAASSIAFAPEIVEPAIAAMHRRYGAGIYGRYGFLDSFNPTLQSADNLKHGRIVPGIGWVDGDYLGIDQGPIVAMMENRDSGLIWRTMRRNPHIVRGLRRAGFTGGWLG